jgi:hypothetical protein
MFKNLILLYFVLLLSGCNTLGENKAELLASPLDTQPDGYSEKLGPKYTILSTKISGVTSKTRRICRVVSFEGLSKFEVKTYCKEKGGAWK